MLKYLIHIIISINLQLLVDRYERIFRFYRGLFNIKYNKVIISIYIYIILVINIMYMHMHILMQHMYIVLFMIT